MQDGIQNVWLYAGQSDAGQHLAGQHDAGHHADRVQDYMQSGMRLGSMSLSEFF